MKVEKPEGAKAPLPQIIATFPGDAITPACRQMTFEFVTGPLPCQTSWPGLTRPSAHRPSCVGGPVEQGHDGCVYAR